MRKWVSSFRNSFFFIDSNRLHRIMAMIVWMRIVVKTNQKKKILNGCNKKIFDPPCGNNF